MQIVMFGDVRSSRFSDQRASFPISRLGTELPRKLCFPNSVSSPVETEFLAQGRSQSGDWERAKESGDWERVKESGDWERVNRNFRYLARA
ncbi:hypothetical protein QUF63_13920 [Anaerolineales bacterium HSG25]|nr:hypothetical protein [Anaerolineales bacterium HSG25]